MVFDERVIRSEVFQIEIPIKTFIAIPSGEKLNFSLCQKHRFNALAF